MEWGGTRRGSANSDDAAALLPDNSQILTRYGDRLVQAGRIDDARKKYEDALRSSIRTTRRRMRDWAACWRQRASFRRRWASLTGVWRSIRRTRRRIATGVSRWKFSAGLLEAAAAYGARRLKNNPDFWPAENAAGRVAAGDERVGGDSRCENRRWFTRIKRWRLPAGENDVRLQTLAAAYAEAGQFEKAIAAAERVLKLVAPDAPIVKEIRAQIELFKAGKAFHQGQAGN